MRQIKESDKVEHRFASWLKQVVDMIGAKFLYLIIGRGSGKTTDIMAERSMEVCYDMPGAQFALTADTYMNLIKNVVPALLEGWNRKGWLEGVHYVVNKRPPGHFAKPYKPIHEFIHTISIYNGCVFKFISQDRPSVGAGDSYQHVFGDEGKYLDKKKLDKLTPASRGGDYVRFSKSPYYRGHTFTSDMANPAHGEHDWMMDMAKYMDPEQIKLILEVAYEINDIRIEIQNLEAEGKSTLLAEKNLDRWLDRYHKIRKNSYFFYVASSFINVDVLTLDFFVDSLSALGSEEFYTSVLSGKPKPPKTSLFYPGLSENCLYTDGYIYENHYDDMEIGHIVENSSGLRHVDEHFRLEAGLDCGNMMSLVVGQTYSTKARVLKQFYTVSPEWIEDLAEKFVNFFEPHFEKELDLYYDRSANNYAKSKKDFASQIKRAIEFTRDGKPTGWKVNLMSRNQGNITHSQEYDLALQMMKGTNPDLPQLLIDKYECKVLLSSIEQAQVHIHRDRDGSVHIQKDKTSEKKYKDNREKLIWLSTNMSDAFKYWLCRPEWLEKAEHRKTELRFDDPEVLG